MSTTPPVLSVVITLPAESKATRRLVVSPPLPGGIRLVIAWPAVFQIPHRTTSLPHCDHPAVAAVDSEPHHSVGLGGSPPAGQRPSIRGPHHHETIPTRCGEVAGLGTGGQGIDPSSL